MVASFSLLLFFESFFIIVFMFVHRTNYQKLNNMVCVEKILLSFLISTTEEVLVFACFCNALMHIRERFTLFSSEQRTINLHFLSRIKLKRKTSKFQVIFNHFHWKFLVILQCLIIFNDTFIWFTIFLFLFQN